MAQDHASTTVVTQAIQGYAVFKRFLRNIENISDTELELCIKAAGHILKGFNPSLIPSKNAHSSQSEKSRPLPVVETPLVEKSRYERQLSGPEDPKLEDYLVTMLDECKTSNRVLTLHELKVWKRARHVSTRFKSIDYELQNLGYERRNAEFWSQPQNLQHKARYDELVDKDVRLGVYSHRGPAEEIFEAWLKAQDYEAWNRWVNNPRFMLGEWLQEKSREEAWEMPWLMAERKRKGEVLWEGKREGLEVWWGNSKEEKAEWRWWVREAEAKKREKERGRKLVQVRKELEERKKVLREREVELKNERRALEKVCRELVKEFGGRDVNAKSYSLGLGVREQRIRERKEEWVGEMRGQELDLLGRGLEPAPSPFFSIQLTDDEVVASNKAFEQRYAQLAFASSLSIFKDEELYRVEELGATIHTPEDSESCSEDCHQEDEAESPNSTDGDFDDGASIHSLEIDRSQPFSWACPVESSSSSEDDDETPSPGNSEPDFVLIPRTHLSLPVTALKPLPFHKQAEAVLELDTDRMCNSTGGGGKDKRRRKVRGKKAVERVKCSPPRTVRRIMGAQERKVQLPPLEW